MKLSKKAFGICVRYVFLLTVFSCSNNDPSPVALTPVTYKNLNADYAPIVFTPTGEAVRPKQTNRFTFFSFLTGTLVNRTDSATAKWDVAFRGTTIIVNGGTNRKGNAGVQLVDGAFEDLLTAPIDGYSTDNQVDDRKPVPTSYAIQDQSEKGWYSFDPLTRLIAPIPEKIIVVKTSDGRYAKMQILSFYQGAPATVNSLADLDRYYTFRYIYQPGNSNSF
ncbi:MAG: hypothetical protein HOP37_11610 [Cyclobacteriaceae bacterium]|nr:hypothetical protein [Cyclobacteriaceae bacterium]